MLLGNHRSTFHDHKTLKTMTVTKREKEQDNGTGNREYDIGVESYKVQQAQSDRVSLGKSKVVERTNCGYNSKSLLRMVPQPHGHSSPRLILRYHLKCHRILTAYRDGL